MEKKAPAKKRRSTLTKGTTEPAEPVKPKLGPYRNIEESKKHMVTSFPDIKKVPIKSEHEFMIIACDGIWDCFTNEQAVKFVRKRKETGPKNGILPGKMSKSMKGLDLNKKQSATASPTKLGKSSSLKADKKLKTKGETSFIIEEMMNQGIAKGDITMSDGTGTDNMTCIIVYFRDPEELKAE